MKGQKGKKREQKIRQGHDEVEKERGQKKKGWASNIVYLSDSSYFWPAAIDSK